MLKKSSGLYNDFEILTVSQLTSQLKKSIESRFGDVWISGEISNFKDHIASGHAYFSLKDEGAMIKAVLFRFNRTKIKFELEDGLEVKAHGHISVYNKRGEYQIVIDFLEPEGMGALQLAFIQLQEKLSKEGLFDPELKKAIPAFPERVGIITSQTGAAIKDILNVMKRRFSSVDVLLYPTTVQGEDAGEDIARQIHLANKMQLADVLIVGRGGGSIEDLWAFNEEVVARAIFDSKIPIISAVGHEVDFTIADFTADLRVPTPSAAAELVVVSKEGLLEELINYMNRMNQAITFLIEGYKEKILRYSADTLSRLFEQKLTQEKLNLDSLTQNISMNMDKKLEQYKNRFKVLHEKILALGPSAILKRGYSLVYLVQKDEKKIITSSQLLKPDDLLEIQLFEGTIKARVE